MYASGDAWDGKIASENMFVDIPQEEGLDILPFNHNVVDHVPSHAHIVSHRASYQQMLL